MGKKGAWETIPWTPMTALPTPPAPPRLINVAGFAVAMNRVDENEADSAVPTAPAPVTARERTPCGEIAFASGTKLPFVR